MSWRVVELLNADIYHMHAVEDIIMDQVEHHHSSNTIILSTVKPSISISHEENYYLDIDEGACARDNIDITRRFSGGRSMYLDQNHLIVSIIRNDHTFIDVSQTYSEGLTMIVDALKAVTGRQFNIRRDDITISNRKIGGASQRNSNTYNMVHCYIRLNTDIDNMLKYVMIDGHRLEPYKSIIKKHVTSIGEITSMTPESFYKEFKRELLKGVESHQADLHQYREDIKKRVLEYMDKEYIKGNHNFSSKGNCDIIVGSGSKAKLIIESLEGKVKFS